MIAIDVKDIREIAKGGGLLLAAIVLVYVCGNEYFLSIFHDCNVGMFVVVPPEIAMNEGVDALFAVFAITASAWAVGHSIGFFIAHRTLRVALIVITILLAATMGYCLPSVAHLAGLTVKLASNISQFPSIV